MPDGYVGEIKLFAGNFAPRGWALCDGQLLSISQNDALFSLLGTIYGGDGRTTFGLPDLRGRAAIHAGSGVQAPRRKVKVADLRLSQFDLNGDGEITKDELDKTFKKLDTNKDGKLASADWEPGKSDDESKEEVTTMRVGQKGPSLAGGGEASGPGTLAINFIIALYGIYPSRS